MVATNPSDVALAGSGTEVAHREDEAVTALEAVAVANDHKVIGRLYVGFGLAMVTVSLIALALANIPNGDDALLGGWAPGIATSFTFGLISLGLLPLLVGLATYVVPLQVGARTSSFPRATAFAFWAWMITSILFLVATLNDGGLGGRSDEMSRLGAIAFAGQMIALLIALVAVATTVFTLRADGMNLRRVPLFSFSILITTFVWTVTTPGIVAATWLSYFDHDGASALRENLLPRLGVLTWAPAALIFGAAVLGAVGDVIVTVSHRRLLNRDIFQDLIALAGVSTVGIWAVKPAGAVNSTAWSALALLGALAVTAYLGGLASHLRAAKPTVTSAAALGIVALLLMELAVLVGAVSAVNTFGSSADGILGLGSVNGLVTTAQFGLAMAAAAAALMAATFHWGVKIFGESPAQKLGGLLAPVVLAGGMLLLGQGVAMVIADTNDSSGAATAAGWLGGVGWLLVGACTAATVMMVVRSKGDGPANPWDGQTLEWSTASPPATDNFAAVPSVSSAAPLLDEAAADEGDK